MSDYNNNIYENSTAILDRSGTAPIECMCSNNVPVISFLESKGVTFAATQTSLSQLIYSNTPNLFTVSPNSINSGVDLSQEFIISRTTGTVTSANYESGPKIEILSSGPTPSITLWDTTTSFKRLSKDEADVSNIYATRSIYRSNFVITNDNDQIKQLRLEGNLYLRPIEILLWMRDCNVITNQKAVWVYNKMSVRDKQWIKKGTTFAKYKSFPR